MGVAQAARPSTVPLPAAGLPGATPAASSATAAAAPRSTCFGIESTGLGRRRRRPPAAAAARSRQTRTLRTDPPGHCQGPGPQPRFSTDHPVPSDGPLALSLAPAVSQTAGSCTGYVASGSFRRAAPGRRTSACDLQTKRGMVRMHAADFSVQNCGQLTTTKVTRDRGLLRHLPHRRLLLRIVVVALARRAFPKQRARRPPRGRPRGVWLGCRLCPPRLLPRRGRGGRRGLPTARRRRTQVPSRRGRRAPAPRAVRGAHV